MTAKEAKKITERKKNSTSMMFIYDQIRKEAERGKSSLIISKFNVTDFMLEVLREKGYGIEAETGDSDYEGRVTGYNITW